MDAVVRAVLLQPHLVLRRAACGNGLYVATGFDALDRPFAKPCAVMGVGSLDGLAADRRELVPEFQDHRDGKIRNQSALVQELGE